jgi:hypothetical protein
VCGQITDDHGSFEQMPMLINDGKPITREAVGRMVASNAGFGVKRDIFDRGEET